MLDVRSKTAVIGILANGTSRPPKGDLGPYIAGANIPTQATTARVDATPCDNGNIHTKATNMRWDAGCMLSQHFHYHGERMGRCLFLSPPMQPPYISVLHSVVQTPAMQFRFLVSIVGVVDHLSAVHMVPLGGQIPLAGLVVLVWDIEIKLRSLR
ncbi:hypothetical protein SODALDRAFT_360412 [Sodiomyces alkalinus F11]|uniref:Uncharacterized protein n=1 Tax=Sodiomyces alkalinus (strain CBS 110278 / VKM F-3762 / F11) TaxID=1314773 RepID=A0A3N2PUA1_SODAK|nr:hypothetical protein SODALDRAFT_360412 [Sodiomyces alkalinus F11]ROT38080.1 hypothetical protein SODALDRAFT_360412 [Sodiomyces alkalinus F11]